MSVPILPPGWRVELLGIINAVEFRGPNGSGLLWTDGKWFQTHSLMSMPAVGVPEARTQKEARRVGTEFLLKVYAED